MEDPTLFRITTWRKRLERRGWISLRSGVPVRDRVVDYEVIWQCYLFKGRMRLGDLEITAGYWEPGILVYFLVGLNVEEGVWRIAQHQGGKRGQVMRRMLDAKRD